MPHEVLLATIVFFVAIWNTSVGPSGAVTFASMATILPPFAVVPIHAVVESTSAIARTAILRKYVNWQFVMFFAAGGLAGFLAGIPAFSLALISEDSLRVILGCTILVVVWAPLSLFVTHQGVSWSFFGGLVTSFLTLFIGATSPLVTAIVHQRNPDHREMLGTSAACMAFQHGGKILIFGLIGFSFSRYGPLIILLLLASVLGTWIGRRVLINVSQDITRPLFRLVVTGLAVHLVWQGMT